MAASAHTTARHVRFVRRVAEMMARQGLVERGDRIVVAVSGGPDSVALLSVLHALAPSRHLSLWVAHFNYGLRGAESEEDASFVRRLCERFNVPYLCERLALAEDFRQGRSLQEAARDARYAALLRVRATLGGAKVALGHTRDDQAETVLMWLLRGAGTTGLSGMPPMRPPFIRPLLTLERAEILSYLAEQELDFREDSSNAMPMYLRNRMRHEVLPFLKRFNPALVDTLTRQADILREDDRCLDGMASEQLLRVGRRTERNEWVMDRTGLLSLPLAVQRRVLRKAIQHTAGLTRGPSYRTVALVIERVVLGRSGASASVHRVNVRQEYGTIRFEPLGNAQAVTDGLLDLSDPSIALPVPFTMTWPLTGQRLQADLVHSFQFTGKSAPLRETHAMVDADRLTLDLRVRAWKPGDRFQPFGLGGHQKKMQDFFADLKVPRPSRGRIPLVIAPEGIVWVAGYRTDHRFRVTASTRRVLRLALLDGGPREPA